MEDTGAKPITDLTAVNKALLALNAAISSDNHHEAFSIAKYIYSNFYGIIPNNTRAVIAAMMHNSSYYFMYKEVNPSLSAQCARLSHDYYTDNAYCNNFIISHLLNDNYDDAWSVPYAYILQGRTGWNPEKPCENLLLKNSNGMGDLIQYIRFIPLAKRYAKNIYLRVPERLASFIRSSPLLDGVHVGSAFDGVTFDASEELFFLPVSLRLAGRDVTPLPQYLHVDDERLSAWRRVIRQSDALHVGLIWSANNAADWRSVGLKRLAALFDVRDVVFVGLQGNQGKEEMFDVALPAHFADYGLGSYSLNGVANTAAIIKALDLVITPDCGPSHLSCALGAETWVLLNRHCDWRWIEPGQRSRWYAGATLFRQQTQDDWTPVIESVRQTLTERARQYRRRHDGRHGD